MCSSAQKADKVNYLSNLCEHLDLYLPLQSCNLILQLVWKLVFLSIIHSFLLLFSVFICRYYNNTENIQWIWEVFRPP